MRKGNKTPDKLAEFSAKLTPKEKLFCEYYTSMAEYFGNGLQSYLNAYGLKPTKTNIDTAKVNACHYLQKPKILAYCNALLDVNGLNDVHVDKQLYKVLTQEMDLGAKMRAVSEYNKLRGRITEKGELKVITKVELSAEDRKLVRTIGEAIARAATGA